jgi:O-6-methylguanine DNA methyltransferase
MKPVRVSLRIPTPDGEFTAHYSEKGLADLDFPKAKKAGRCATNTHPVSLLIRTWHGTTVAALKKLLQGEKPVALPPLDWGGKTEFQKQVWRVMVKIPRGKTLSYGEIAAAIGRPKASRAVGGACGANPIPVLVPCHRVLAANQRIGGFSGGLEWKRRLLAREGVTHFRL